MKKLFAVALATMVVAGLAFGQGMPGKGMMSLGIGGELSIPTATDFSDANGMGFGGSGRFQYGLQDNVTLYGTVGYMYWPQKEDVQGFDYKLTGLEFLAGGKYGFGSGFYGLAELGISSFTATVDINDPILGTFSAEESESKFMLAPGVGYAWKGLTIEAKYYLLDSDFANLRFRVGYDFAL
jgi:hypothetical protein